MADTDSDGIPNIIEKANGTDPLLDDAASDPDSDGLTNLEEYLLGTGPSLDNAEMADTDNDGIPDQVEIMADLDLSADNSVTDSDDDGLSDVVEYRNGTLTIDNASLGDNDSDGLPDIWEKANGLDPDSSNIDVDTDGDGINDVTEYIMGLTPISANQPPSPVEVTTKNGAKFVRGNFVKIMIKPSVDPEGMTVSYAVSLYEGLELDGMPLEKDTVITPDTGYIPGITLSDDRIYTAEIRACDGFLCSPATIVRFVVTEGTIDGDIDYTKTVDGYDLILMSVVFGKNADDPVSNPFADLNDDGIIDGSDLAILASNFGQHKP